MSRFIIDIRYRNILLLQGIDPAAVLKAAMLPADILNRSAISISEEQYHAFLDAIDRVGKEPGLAMRLATAEGIERFSPPIFAAYCGKNGRTCLKRLARFKRLIGPMSLEIIENEDSLTAVFLPGDSGRGVSGFIAECELAFVVNLLRKATGEHITPLYLSAGTALKDNSLRDYVGIRVDEGDSVKIVFRASDMDRPFVSFDDNTWDYFEPRLNRRLAALDGDESVGDRVKNALTELLPAGVCSIEKTAAELGLSKRTLQRKLNGENTTFQSLLGETRRELALHYLNNTTVSSNDIAFLLGYAEVNSFLRAFAAWTGKSVTEYRQALRKNPKP